MITRFAFFWLLIVISILPGCTLVSSTTNQPAQTPSADTATTTENIEFNKSGSEEMYICDNDALCHKGQVLFADGEVITITAADASKIEVADSTCDEQSCYLEDVQGREWDLVWIR